MHITAERILKGEHKMMIPQYSTKTFTDVWNNDEEFISFYHGNGIPATITDTSARTLFYLLYAQYGNSPIANDDVNQFKYKAMSVIFKFGPTWEKRLYIQEQLRNLTEEELRTGGKQIFNHSFNPSTEPSTSTTEELLTVNDQNVTNSKRGKMEAYSYLNDMLETDLAGFIVDKFKTLFKQFVQPEHPVLYVDEGEEY